MAHGSLVSEVWALTYTGPSMGNTGNVSTPANGMTILEKPQGLSFRRKPLVEVQDLSVTYAAGTGEPSPALSEVSFALECGETLGVVGESGSGKTTLAAALLELLQGSGKTPKGVVRFEGHDLLRASASELQRIRGRIGAIFQEPLLALPPALRVREQVGDVLAAHQPMSRRAIREKSLEALKAVFSLEAERIADSYPHHS